MLGENTKRMKKTALLFHYDLFFLPLSPHFSLALAGRFIVNWSYFVRNWLK